MSDIINTIYDRRDKCKCGKEIIWSTDNDTATCAWCNTEYKVDCDSVLVYWLEEIIHTEKPWTTDAR